MSSAEADPGLAIDPRDPWGYAGRRVVVTGAASGMGAAAVAVLAGLGAEVIGVDVQAMDAPALAERVTVDLGDPASIAAAAGTIDGPVDGLLNCAGIPGTAPARAVLAVNFCGLRELTERLVPKMSPGSAICNVGSTAAVSWPLHAETLLELMVIDGHAAALDWLDAHLGELGYPYDVSKEAVNVYTAWRSVDLNELGIRINCINPGGTRTPASREFTKAVRSKDFGAEMIEHWPKLMGRMATPAEQAWPMVFLNSRYASFTTGASFFVDAGLTAGVLTQRHHPMVAAGMFWRPPR